jgi:hypothetical protein
MTKRKGIRNVFSEGQEECSGAWKSFIETRNEYFVFKFDLPYTV